MSFYFKKYLYIKQLFLFKIFVKDLPAAQIKVQGEQEYSDEFYLSLKPEEEASYEIFVKIPEGESNNFAQKEFTFVVEDIRAKSQIEKNAMFIANKG